MAFTAVKTTGIKRGTADFAPSARRLVTMPVCEVSDVPLWMKNRFAPIAPSIAMDRTNDGRLKRSWLFRAQG